MRYSNVLIGALATLLAACGGGSGGGSNQPPTSNNPPPAAPPSEPPPVIGLDARPPNNLCVAWSPSVSTGEIRLERAFGTALFESPLFALQAPEDQDNWYVVEQNGRVRRLAASSPSNVTTFIDIAARVASPSDNAGSETGLLGMAFHPNYPTTPRAYLSYTHRVAGGPLVSRISEFSMADAGALDPDSERVLLTATQPFNNHNGGHIAFGADGYLYIALGDGGSGGDPQNNAQRLTNLLGKMLRIDVNAGTPYGIPADNPFASGAMCGTGATGSTCAEIYAYGFRNPWRWSFDRVTGQLWLADVGQNAWEEVNVVTRGGNYGWRCREGAHDHNTASCPTSGLIDPVAEYPHRVNGQSTGNQSITGGYVYRGPAAHALRGRYLFADFASGRIWAARSNSREPEELLATGLNISSFAEGHDGELFVISFDGAIRRIVFDTATATDNAPDRLTTTACVDPSNPTTANASVIGYSVNAPFWSDGADKERFIGLPASATIAVGSDGDWDVPVGSVLMKNFELESRLIETRLLMRHDADQWSGYTYAWNAQQTEATRVRGGERRTLFNGQDWLFPSEVDCFVCHTSAAGRTLGLTTAQLNRDHTYAQTNRTANQIRTLAAIQVTASTQVGPSGLPAMPDPTNTSASLTSRARAWLDTNCSNCHRPGGPTNSNMDLRYATAFANTQTCNATPNDALGLTNMRIITPGAAAQSMIVNRIDRRDEHQMPPLGSLRVDTAGVALISEWIATLTGCE